MLAVPPYFQQIYSIELRMYYSGFSNCISSSFYLRTLFEKMHPCISIQHYNAINVQVYLNIPRLYYMNIYILKIKKSYIIMRMFIAMKKTESECNSLLGYGSIYNNKSQFPLQIQHKIKTSSHWLVTDTQPNTP